jgi:glycosyltransferase involved in cell wall biosynthesis
MKKILIVYKVFSDDEGTKGVHRKMLEQGRSLERLGAKVDMVNLHSKGLQLDGKLIAIKNLTTKSSRNFFTLFDFYSSLKKIDGVTSYDIYYIRYSPLTFGFMSFLKYIKKNNPSAKIYIELPTYPFIAEYQGLKKILVQMIAQRQKHLKKYVTNILSVGSESNIWGIPVVSIKNAIDPESYKLRNPVKVQGVIRLVMVSTFWNWHGVDRLVNGLINYMSSSDKKYNVYLTLIGEGPELNKIVALAEHGSVKDNVFFYSSTYGGELNQFFDQADIAIGTLAVDRINLEDCSALKHREYGARGIPFVYAGSDLSFNEKDFVLRLPLKEGPVDFSMIEKFYEMLNARSDHYTPQAIKSRVSEDLSWESQLKFLVK